MRSRTAWIHPFLFAACPVLSLYSININQLLPSIMAVPLGIYFAVTAILLAVFGGCYRHIEKGALMASAVILVSTILGHGFEVLDRGTLGKFLLDEYRWVWSVLILVFLYGLYRGLRKLPSVGHLTRAAWVTALVLIAFPSVHILSYYHRDVPAAHSEPSAAPSTATPSLNGPDIYYIILDGYGRQDVLADQYGYDNRPFVEGLQKMGFRVMPQSRSNYSFTAQSLASSLNMSYIDQLDRSPNQEEESMRLIQENSLMPLLKSKGYQIIHFSSGWVVTGRDLPVADMNFNCRSLNHYTVMLAQTSLLRFFMRQALYVASQRDVLFYNLSKLKDIPRMPNRKFVFLHLVCPHPPFVFDRQGGMPERTKAMRRLEADWLPRERYIDQLHYLNGRILEAARQIIALSPTPPVIVIQGDHGPATDQLTAHPTPEVVKMRTSILNAYYLPGKGRDQVYPTITPVNTFRLILNTYLGTSLPLLKDKTYYSGPIGASPYTFMDVTAHPGSNPYSQ